MIFGGWRRAKKAERQYWRSSSQLKILTFDPSRQPSGGVKKANSCTPSWTHLIYEFLDWDIPSIISIPNPSEPVRGSPFRPSLKWNTYSQTLAIRHLPHDKWGRCPFTASLTFVSSAPSYFHRCSRVCLWPGLMDPCYNYQKIFV